MYNKYSCNGSVVGSNVLGNGSQKVVSLGLGEDTLFSL